MQARASSSPTPAPKVGREPSTISEIAIPLSPSGRYRIPLSTRSGGSGAAVRPRRTARAERRRSPRRTVGGRWPSRPLLQHVVQRVRHRLGPLARPLPRLRRRSGRWSRRRRPPAAPPRRPRRDAAPAPRRRRGRGGRPASRPGSASSTGCSAAASCRRRSCSSAASPASASRRCSSRRSGRSRATGGRCSSRARSRSRRSSCAPRGSAAASGSRSSPRPSSTSVCATLERERPDVCVIDSVQTLHAAEIGSAPGLGRAGARGGGADPAGRQGGRRRDLPRRSRHQGRLARRAARARAPRRLRAPVRGRPLPRPPRPARDQEPVRLDQRARRLRDDGGRARRRARPLGASSAAASRARSARPSPACSQGTRPLLLEIQSLVAPSDLAMPRRVGTGVDQRSGSR